MSVLEVTVALVKTRSGRRDRSGVAGFTVTIETGQEAAKAQAGLGFKVLATGFMVKAEIVLEDPENPLESGIIINVQPPGKKLKSINWLSGGERDLSSIALLFSIFLVKPSPFCAFDEIDAELDEENTRKFISLTKEFSQSVQFILISHNPNTIANVDYLYGVSMEEKGVSKIVSLELRKENYDKYIKQENEKK